MFFLHQSPKHSSVILDFRVEHHECLAHLTEGFVGHSDHGKDGRPLRVANLTRYLDLEHTPAIVDWQQVSQSWDAGRAAWPSTTPRGAR